VGRVLPPGSTASLLGADPSQVPAGVFLQVGQPRSAAGPGNTLTTTWCMSSCPGAGGGGPPPLPPGGGGHGGHKKNNGEPRGPSARRGENQRVPKRSIARTVV